MEGVSQMLKVKKLFTLLAAGLLVATAALASPNEYRPPAAPPPPPPPPPTSKLAAATIPATTLVLVDEKGQPVWRLEEGERPSPEALKKAKFVLGLDPRGIPVFKRPLVFADGEVLVDMGWGKVKLEELIAQIKENAKMFAKAPPPPPTYGGAPYPPPPPPPPGYYYDDDWYKYRYPYYDDDWYEYRYRWP